MYAYLKKLIFKLDPESAHHWVKRVGAFIPSAPLSLWTKPKSEALKTQLGSVDLRSPIGLAAGFDKNGEMIDLLDALGFGFLEIGSVTALPCEGNPKPRIFRLMEDESIINRMGLPNDGAEVIAGRLEKKKPKGVLGINITKTPANARGNNQKVKGIDDFVQCFHRMHRHGAYIVFNLSCPNTGDGRTFEDPRLFADLAKALEETRRELDVTKPILVKLSPNLPKEDLHPLVDTAFKYNFDGFVVSNTTSGREGLKTPIARLKEIGNGGLSGAGLRALADKQLSAVHQITKGKKILMGVGGVMEFEDLIRKMALGAQFVQVYTGLIYRGPFFIAELNRKLDRFCQQKGLKKYNEIVGCHEFGNSVK